MNHFMGNTATLADAHAARVIVDSKGNSYLVTQTHMATGFALNVQPRINNTDAVNTWEDAAPLNREGADEANKIEMSHDALTTIIDGQDNIRAIWKEQQSGAMRLMMAVYNTTDKQWGDAAAIFDSEGDTHGIDLSTIHSLSASGEHDTALVHVAMLVDTTDDEAIYTMDFDGAAWGNPMRRDEMGDMTMLSDVQHAVYHGDVFNQGVAVYSRQRDSIRYVGYGERRCYA